MECMDEFSCVASTYQERTSVCTLHGSGSSQPLMTEYRTGFLTLTFKGSRVPVDLRFDVDTLPSKLFVSAEKRVLSSSPSESVMVWPPGSYQLTTYKGVISNICVAPGKIFHYEFAYEYLLLETFSGNEIVIEFGIADKTTVDNDIYCGTSAVDGWSFPINNCLHTKICLEAWRSDVGYLEIPISENIAGTYKTGVFVVLLDRDAHTLSLFEKENSSLIYSYIDVISDANLCPVFSVGYDVNASFTILNAYDLN